MKLPVSHSSIDYGSCRVDSPSDRRAVACNSADLNSEISVDQEPAELSRPEIPRWKRLLDLACILITLPVWLGLFLVITIWIKQISPGPLFFCQDRVGYRGKRFRLFKFRTMKVNVETQSHERHFEQLMQANAPMTKLDARDPRIIWGGRFIRAAGLDELPQLFNVLRGEMSLVGPRPCTTQEFEKFLPGQRERTNSVPGLTGFWQVNGKNKTTFSQMIEMDIYYARNASLPLDLSILLKTPVAIIRQVLETRFFVSAGKNQNAVLAAAVEEVQGRVAIARERQPVGVAQPHLQPAE
jgi:lipopolysaccharide/colanic/teichoic acid biosynthesis glycosyltransferase